MHQLILLRHAKAVPEAKGADHERGLTETGRAAATAMGRAMVKAGLAPEVVLLSTAARTQQTFEQLVAANVWEEWPNIDNLPSLYMATPGEICDSLRALPETVRSAMVIGHNPGLHLLALSLAGQPAAGAEANPATQTQNEATRLTHGFPTAALAVFHVTTTWHRLGAGAALQVFLTPQDLL